MKRFFIISLTVLSIISVSAQVSFGQPEKINTTWKFTLGDQKDAKDRNYNDQRWQIIDLPHDWTIKGQLSPNLASCTGFLPGGIGWYRKKIQISENRKSQKVYLYFEGVYNRSEVYLNGNLLGKRPNGYISFMYDVTPFVEFGKENVIAVRVDHSQSADSRWYSGSGIYRDVFIVYSNPVHIAQWGVYSYPEVVSQEQSFVNVEVELNNDSEITSKLSVKTELFAPNGKSVAKAVNNIKLTAGNSGKVEVKLKLNNPILWDLDHPELYTLKTEVSENGKLLDQSSTKTGIRKYSFDPDKGFALNGKWMKIKGVCLHHDAGVLGAAVYKDVWKRRLITLKKLGCNAIRTSHNPQATSIYDICDEIGLLVMNEAFDEWEFPKRKWIEGWNVGTPGFQGTFDFFKEWGEKDLTDMVRRDRNHISIFAWSIGNEVDYPNDPYSHPILAGDKETGFTQPIFGGYKKDAPDAMRLGNIAKSLATVVRKFDLSRPVTAGLAGVAMSNETEYPSALDIAGYNYTENRYKTDHNKYPKRVIFGSENRHEFDAWKSVTENEFVFGQFLWTGIDYLGESGRWPSRGFYSGLLDFGGFIKPRGYFRQSLWSDKPIAYIGTYPSPESGVTTTNTDVWSQLEAEQGNIERSPSMDAWPLWNYNEGQLIRVVTYTNAAKARLLLNGKEAGELKNYDNKTGIIYWDIPYSHGKLEIVGMNAAGSEIVRKEIQSSKRPYALKIEEKRITINKETDIVHVVVQVVDEDGVPVMLADNEVSCHVVGSLKLLGLEGSNNEDMSDYTDSRHRVFNGRLLAYFKPTGVKGQAKIRFTSPLLKSDEMTIEIP
jgi:beta-galactosidase/beta-glucuronidase